MVLSKKNTDSLLNDVDFNFSDYFCYRAILGKGSFGHVVLAISKGTLETMAVKVFYWFN